MQYFDNDVLKGYVDHTVNKAKWHWFILGLFPFHLNGPISYLCILNRYIYKKKNVNNPNKCDGKLARKRVLNDKYITRFSNKNYVR